MLCVRNQKKFGDIAFAIHSFVIFQVYVFSGIALLEN